MRAPSSIPPWVILVIVGLLFTAITEWQAWQEAKRKYQLTITQPILTPGSAVFP